MKLKTKQLENCLRVIEYYLDGDAGVIEELLNPKINLVDDYVKPFTRELKKNLLITESREGKEDLIKYYIWEFRDINEYYVEKADLMWERKKGMEDKKYEFYLIECFKLYNLIFSELQYACFKYGINLEDICYKLQFNSSTFEWEYDLYAGAGLGFDLNIDIDTSPTEFCQIFVVKQWRHFIDVLYQIEQPIINSDYEYIGKRAHKGVIASWIKELQNKGKIHKKFNRQTLVEVLNNEIKGLDMGKEGKTFDNISSLYTTEYRQKLLQAVNLMPQK